MNSRNISIPGPCSRALFAPLHILVGLVLLLVTPSAPAQVNYQFVTVGNPGNANDATGYGGVSYVYDIGKYDVTLNQYTTFLNAVANSDPYGLYYASMGTDLNVAGISRSGSSGSYSYSVIGDGNRPVAYISWFDAARFSNWLQNGQPTGLGEVAGSTEQGAYTLNGDTSSGLEAKNANALYWIPSESEWYKAAYYDPTLNSGTGGYWTYATRSNTAPGNVVGSGSNQANYNNGLFAVTQSGSYSSSQNYLTDVGAFSNSASAYGSFDQNGDVRNWNDAVISGTTRGLRGGSWINDASNLQSSDRLNASPAGEASNIGFRVATVPEPTAAVSLIFAGGLLFSRRKRSRSRALFIALLALCLAGTAALRAQITDLATFNGANGQDPYAELTLSGSTLYGTTGSGGANGYGEVFSVPVGGGAPTVLASFNNTNGQAPHSRLTLSGSTLYGTTAGGGANGGGEVFSVPVSGGTPTVLASFTGSNGSAPDGGLTLSGTTLYGTTDVGGANNDGTVFSLPVGGGTPTILASFSGSNGSDPNRSLTLSGGTLYGNAATGGANGYGAVFSLPIGGGSPTVLASFNSINGSYPNGLILGGGTLYGTTESGGIYDGGEVFSLPVGGGTPTILASFNYNSPGGGAYPQGGLTLSADGSTLYGTTESGGANNYGEVFSLPVGGGTPTILASFNNSNGAYPQGALTLSSDGSTLYGMTSSGGVNNDGVVFSVPTPEPGSAALLALGVGALVGRRRRISKKVFGRSTRNTLWYLSSCAVLTSLLAFCVAGTTTSQAQITDLASFNGTNGNGAPGSLTLIGSTFYGTTKKTPTIAPGEVPGFVGAE